MLSWWRGGVTLVRSELMYFELELGRHLFFTFECIATLVGNF